MSWLNLHGSNVRWYILNLNHQVLRWYSWTPKLCSLLSCNFPFIWYQSRNKWNHKTEPIGHDIIIPMNTSCPRNFKTTSRSRVALSACGRTRRLAWVFAPSGHGLVFCQKTAPPLISLFHKFLSLFVILSLHWNRTWVKSAMSGHFSTFANSPTSSLRDVDGVESSCNSLGT